ncbi:MAG: DUF547 domain-containing protein [Deltaproteobacteria bacterium]|nr:DUF547 domain-containing protein [Deltaproteobacteria bacterium]
MLDSLSTKICSVFFLLLVSTTTSLVHAQQSVDHSIWNRILKITVTHDGWVDYQRIRDEFTGELKEYITYLGNVSPENLDTAKEQKAFWINAYNALTVQKLLDAGLPAKVPKAAFFGKNIFKERTYRVGRKLRSLDDIEHGILRKRFKDNRIHAELVCGASSCPRLRAEAYTAGELDSQLDEEARRWVQTGLTRQGQRKNYLDRENDTYYVSKIFNWFAEDFGGDDKGVLQFLTRHGSDEDRVFLKNNRVQVRYLKYDWSLNSRPEKAKGTILN